MKFLSIVITALLVCVGTAEFARAQADQTLTGTVLWMGKEDRRLMMRTDDNRLIRVHLGDIDKSVRRDLQPGDRVTVKGVEVDRRNDETVIFANSVTESTANAPAATTNQQWQRIHGHVQSVDGSKLTFKADDGRVLQVDMKAVNPSIQKALTQNEGATLIGHPGGSANQFLAQYIQQDNSDPSRGGTFAGQPSPSSQPQASSGAASTEQQKWQRIHGTVQSVSGDTLRVKADDGRTLTVDMAQVNADVRGAMAPGKAVTLVGFPGTGKDQFTARYIAQDRGAQPAASPKTTK